MIQGRTIVAHRYDINGGPQANKDSSELAVYEANNTVLATWSRAVRRSEILP